MLAALKNLAAYQSQHNLSNVELLTIGDINHDGVVTTADLAGLLNLLAAQRVLPATPILGDFNLDGHLTAGDVAAMLSALADLKTFKSSDMSDAYLLAIGDINHDGVVSNADVTALLTLLVHGSSGSAVNSTVPVAALEQVSNFSVVDTAAADAPIVNAFLDDGELPSGLTALAADKFPARPTHQQLSGNSMADSNPGAAQGRLASSQPRGFDSTATRWPPRC